MSARKLVEAFLGLKPTSLMDLEIYCATELEFTSPLERTNGLRDYLLARHRLGHFASLELKKIFEDGSDVCVIYTKKFDDSHLGEMNFTDWFHVRDGKIVRIESNFNARPLAESFVTI